MSSNKLSIIEFTKLLDEYELYTLARCLYHDFKRETGSKLKEASSILLKKYQPGYSMRT